MTYLTTRAEVLAWIASVRKALELSDNGAEFMRGAHAALDAVRLAAEGEKPKPASWQVVDARPAFNGEY